MKKLRHCQSVTLCRLIRECVTKKQDCAASRCYWTKVTVRTHGKCHTRSDHFSDHNHINTPQPSFLQSSSGVVRDPKSGPNLIKGLMLIMGYFFISSGRIPFLHVWSNQQYVSRQWKELEAPIFLDPWAKPTPWGNRCQLMSICVLITIESSANVVQKIKQWSVDKRLTFCLPRTRCSMGRIWSEYTR